jgi:NhaP-type Na+/H+ or K+/H+ antiporter
VGFKVDLDPTVFFFLFIPPLLFLDGWRIPKGAMFVLLGEQLPSICNRLMQGASGNRFAFMGRAVGYVLAITLAMTALRFVWVWASLRLTLFRQHSAQATVEHSMTRALWVTSFAGVRGAITLAGILTLPVLLPNSAAFPARDPMIFLAMGVILSSLIIGSIALPLLTKGMTFVPSAAPADTIADARASAARAAIQRIEDLQASATKQGSAIASHPEIAATLLDWYQNA